MAYQKRAHTPDLSNYGASDGVGVGASPVRVGDGAVPVGDEVGVPVACAVGAGVGLADAPVKEMLGLALLVLVTVKLLVVSSTFSVTVPETAEETVNFASPFDAFS